MGFALILGAYWGWSKRLLSATGLKLQVFKPMDPRSVGFPKPLHLISIACILKRLGTWTCGVLEPQILNPEANKP